MQKFIVDKKFDNKKLSEYLFSKFNGLTKNTLYKAFRKKDIRINNVKISEDSIIHVDDEITVYIIDDLLFKKFNIEKVYEDENILVINKPNNIEVVGSQSLTSILEKEYAYIAPCHRLDRNTTGLLLFAKNEKSLNILLDKFKNKEIEKHYIAKVYDARILQKELNEKFSTSSYKITLKKGITQNLVAYLFKDNKKAMVYISDLPKKGYVKIETSFTLLTTKIDKECDEKYYILDVELHTGKTHQIRAHLAHIGLPIIGDGKYGINEVNKKFGSKTQELCSYKLKFNFTTGAGELNYLRDKEISLSYTSYLC